MSIYTTIHSLKLLMETVEKAELSPVLLLHEHGDNEVTADI